MTALLEVPSEKVIAAAAQNAVSPPRRLLLADDDTDVLELSAVVLTSSGYKVDTAVDGAAAWQALQDVSYDLLITDNKMPSMTGLELVKTLRSAGMTLPVIMASGTVPTEELKQHPWLQLGATLPKPFTIAELLDVVKKILHAADSVASSAQLFRDCAMLDEPGRAS